MKEPHEFLDQTQQQVKKLYHYYFGFLKFYAQQELQKILTLPDHWNVCIYKQAQTGLVAILFDHSSSSTIVFFDVSIKACFINFPEAFLKRWIKLSATAPIADEDIEKEFEAYLKSLKWQLIQTKIFKDSDTKLVSSLIDRNQPLKLVKDSELLEQALPKLDRRIRQHLVVDDQGVVTGVIDLDTMVQRLCLHDQESNEHTTAEVRHFDQIN